MPTFILVAGPNGSGKSTLTASIRFPGITEIVDPDAIARTIRPEQPALAAVAAARQAIRRCSYNITTHASFVVESTLAGHGAIAVMRRAKDAGYRTLLVYVALGDPELHVERVRLRVTQGGHDIPDADIRRRYGRSLIRAPEAIRLADEALVLDNSGIRPDCMLAFEVGRMVWKASNCRAWAEDILRRTEVD
ncbi:MAG: AAA family ATPase [Bryobacteraceae bacterium]